MTFDLTSSMAKSMFEYVKKFERVDKCLPSVWLVCRIDGCSFHSFAEKHNFEKPNDEAALNLMNECATQVMMTYHGEIILSYGQSDEYSFILRKESNHYTRRASKLISTIVSCFASNYVFNWSKFFPTKPLLESPMFDARIIEYPTDKILRDYLSWRQADCHINNLYNTCFWNLIKVSGLERREAKEQLHGTDSSYKNELLFSKFGINYNNLPQIYRKGTVLIWPTIMKADQSKDICSQAIPKEGIIEEEEESEDDKALQCVSQKEKVVRLHVDIIGDTFWNKTIFLQK